jgi:hypothetical protein
MPTYGPDDQPAPDQSGPACTGAAMSSTAAPPSTIPLNVCIKSPLSGSRQRMFGKVKCHAVPPAGPAVDPNNMADFVSNGRCSSANRGELAIRQISDFLGVRGQSD